MTSFPSGPLGIEADLYLGSWTSMGDYIYQRDPVSITRGRANESATISPSQCTMTLNNRDNRFTIRNPVGAWYGLIGQNTPFRLSVPAALTGGGTYLRMEDDNISNASCPDTSSLHITGTLDVRIDFQLSGYNGGQSLIGKATVASPGWELIVNGDGTVTLFWWTTGAAIQSAQSTLPLPYLGRIMVRAVLSTSGQTVTFYTAATMSGSQTQLGATIATGSTSLTAASGTAVYVGCSYSPGANGQFYEARIYSGAGGTLEANPVFSSQTAGATSFTDAQSNTWTINGTAELSSKLYRFHGELASLPKAADPSQHDVYSQATASGILRRLQQAQNPANSAMYRAYVRLPADLNLVAYWPMEDGTNATSFGSALSGGLPMIWQGTPTLFSNSDFACSDELPVINSAVIRGSIPADSSVSWTANIVRFLMEVPSGGDTNGAVICRYYTTGTVHRVDLVYGTGGTLTLTGYDASGTQLFTSGAVAFAVNGELLRVSVELTTSGISVGWGIVVIQPGQEAVDYTGTYSTASTGAVTSVVLDPTGNLVSTVLGHLSVQATEDSLYDLSSALNAWNGETAGNRYSRLCSEEGIACRIYGFPDNCVAMGNQTLETIADLLQECETTDMGMQFEPRTCLGLGYVTRQALYNLAAAVTADYSLGQVSQGFSASSDDLLALNDVTATNADGSAARQVLETGPMSVLSPPDGIGRVDTSITVNAATDDDLASLANWMLWVRSVNDDRYPVIPFDLAKGVSGGVVTPAGAPLLDVGSFLEIISTPSWIPVGPVKQICAGFTETLGPAGIWTIGVNGVPELPYEIAIVSTSKVDTDGSSLATGITSSATSMSVDVTAGAALWTTSGGQLPFDILMGGERITVGAVSGSSSPQTFSSLTRSVNGVVKSHSSGETIALFNTPVVGL